MCVGFAMEERGKDEEEERYMRERRVRRREGPVNEKEKGENVSQRMAITRQQPIP